MAHVPMGDIQEMWKDAPHNWPGLHQWLEQHKGKSQGISDNLVDMMSRITGGQHRSFPDSPQQMYDFFNGQVEHSGHEHHGHDHSHH